MATDIVFMNISAPFKDIHTQYTPMNLKNIPYYPTKTIFDGMQ